MQRSTRFVILLLTFMLVLAGSMTAFAQDDADEVPPAEITNDEGGVVRIVGEVPYTVGFLTDFNQSTINVAMVNAANYVDRVFTAEVFDPVEWQTLGRVTSTPFQSPFTYEIDLPLLPPGPSRDVDNDSVEEDGVRFYSIGVFIDTTARATSYWDQLTEYGAGLTSYISAESIDFELRYDVAGGKFLVWAPDDAQAIPAGFGEDGMLFTEDDPMMSIPAGWSVIDMGDGGEDFRDAVFTLDRSEIATVDLIEQEQSLQPSDYSDLTYSEAFLALLNQMREEYSFTELKGVDFDALEAEFLPRFVEAEENEDPVAYQFALRDFSWAIPDGHIGAGLPLTNDAFFAETDGSVGIAIRTLDDGRTIVNYLVEGSPAQAAGIELGTEIVAINGMTVEERANEVNIWSAPFSSDHARDFQALRYAVRFEVGEEVDITFINADGEEETATMTAIAERESWSFTSVLNGAPGDDVQPLTFDFLEDSGYGYIQINTFSDFPEITLRNWEWAIDWMNANAVPGVIIDLRFNGGGYNISSWMAGYLTQEEVVIGNSAEYQPALGEFFVDPVNESVIRPAPDGTFYGGEVVVLTGLGCFSECEFFSYSLSLLDNVSIVGFYPTEGLGGNITPVFMPDGVRFQFTTGRALNTEGGIRLEGIGVPLDVQVPVTEETLFYDGDLLLDRAIEILNEATTIPVTDGGSIAAGDSVDGELILGERIQYTWIVEEAGFYDIVVTSDDPSLDTVMNIYVAPDTSAPAVSNDDIEAGVFTSGFFELEVPAGLELIVEIGGFQDAAEGAFTLSLNVSGEGEAEEGAADEGGETEAEAPGNIAEVATAAGDFSTLLTIVDAAGLTDALTGEGPITVFAPTDAAFDALFEQLGIGLGDAVTFADLLVPVLQYHIVDGAVLAEDVTALDGGEAETLQGETIKILVEDGAVVLNGDVNVVLTDIVASNGVIHVIDAVLLPQETIDELTELGLLP